MSVWFRPLIIRRNFGTHPSHSIDCRLSELMVQVISFNETNAMFSGNSTLHLDSALYHSVHDVFGDFSLGFIEEENCWWLLVGGRLPARGGRGELTVEVAISNVSDYA
jgi:hypothetical protein